MARADCPTEPPECPNGVIEGLIASGAESSTVAMDGQGRFVISYVTISSGFSGNDPFAVRFAASGLCDDCAACPLQLTLPSAVGNWGHASIAMGRGTVGDSPLLLSITGNRPTGGADAFFIFTWASTYATFAGPNFPSPSMAGGAADQRSSAGVNLDGAVTALSWDRQIASQGIHYAGGGSGDQTLLACGGGVPCDNGFWQQSVAVRDDGKFVVAYARRLNGGDTDFNIRLRQFDQSGVQIGNEVTVNEPTVELLVSTQRSCAVAILDDAIVVTWVGPSYTDPNIQRVYARQLEFNSHGTPTAISGQFTVDNAPGWALVDLPTANPAVAICNSNNGELAGRFIVAWNTARPPEMDPRRREIHARYFDADGTPLSNEFRLHQPITDPIFNDADFPQLAESAQHTIAYGPVGQVVATWTRTAGPNNSPPRVYYTYLPPSFLGGCTDNLCELRGDVNESGAADAEDIQPFVDAVVTGVAPDLCRTDVNGDCVVSVLDVDPFVCLLLTGDPAGCDTDGCQSESGLLSEEVGPGGGEGQQAESSTGESQIQPESQSGYSPTPQEAAFVAWLVENPYWPRRHELTLSQYQSLVRAKMVEFGIVKRWAQ